MLTPRYYFAEDFRPFQDYFLSQPHTEKTFRKGGRLSASSDTQRTGRSHGKSPAGRGEGPGLA